MSTKTNWLWQRGAALFAVALAAALASLPAAAGVRINEVQSSNDDTYTDENSSSPDWVELYNDGTAAVDLSGWGLTDKAKKPYKWTFPSGASIAAGGYLVVCCDAKDTSNATKGYYHTSFSLSSSGETLTLTSKDGTESDTTTFARVPCDTSWGRNGSGDWVYYAKPTPGAANSGTEYTSILQPVQFSPQRKLVTDLTSFEVTLTSPDGAAIYYTTNGADPTTSSTKVASGTKITVSPDNVRGSAVIIKAMPYKSGALSYRNIQAHSYIYLQKILSQTRPNTTYYPDLFASGVPGSYGCNTTDIVTNNTEVLRFYRAITNIPILSISSSDANLKACYISSSDVVASFEWIDHTGDTNMTFCFDAVLKKAGAGSRTWTRTPKKSFRFTCKGKYGGNLQKPIFSYEGYNDTGFKNIVLRGEHNCAWPTISDTPNRNGMEYLKDQMIRELQLQASGIGARGTFVHLFFNGLYWGVYNPVERPDADSGARMFGGNADDYASFKLMETRDGTTAMVNTWNNWNNALYTAWYARYKGGSYASSYGATSANGYGTDMTVQANYEYMASFVNIEKFIDYMQVIYWSANGDWPGNNWVSVGSLGNDIPYTFYVWDAENSFADNSTWKLESWYPGARYDSAQKRSPMFIERALTNSSEYAVRVMDRVHELYDLPGGALTQANIKDKFNKLRDRGRIFLYGEEARWGDYRKIMSGYSTTCVGKGYVVGLDKVGSAGNKWETRTAKVLSSFIPSRRTFILNKYKKLYGIWYPDDSWKTPDLVYNSASNAVTMTIKDASNTIYYTTDGTDPRTYWTGDPSPTAQIYTSGDKITSNKKCTLKVRLRKADGKWSYLVTGSIKASGTAHNAYMKTTTGKNWDTASNWSEGAYPNAAGAYADIGTPTEASDKGWRNIHLNKTSVTVGHIDFTNGGWTNRIDTGTSGSITFKCGTGTNATITVTDASGNGLAMIDLDEPNKIVLASDLTLSAVNPAGDSQWGSIYLKGILDGGSKNIVKTGAGKATIGCTNAAGTKVASATVSAGTLAFSQELHITGGISGAGTAQFAVQGTNDTSVAEDAVVLGGSLSTTAVKLFVKTRLGGTYYGGVIAKGSLPAASKCTVYIKADTGTFAFKGDAYKQITDATITTYTIASGTYKGYYTYKVVVPEQEVEVASGAYTWGGATSGDWASKSSWTGVTGGTWPQLRTDAALFPATVVSATTVDLGGGDFAIGAVTNNSTKLVTFKNGRLSGKRITLATDTAFENVAFYEHPDSDSRMYPCNDGVEVTFTGTNAFEGAFYLRCNNPGLTFNFDYGETTMNDVISVSTACTSLLMNFDNARLETAACAPATAPLTLTMKLGALNAKEAVFEATGVLKVNSGSTLAVDATRVGAGTYTLLKAGTLTDSASLSTAASVTVASGFIYTLAESSTALTLTIAASSGKTTVSVPTLSNTTCTYDGDDHKPTMKETTGVAFTYSAAEWIDAGTYTVTCTLTDTSAYQWGDGTTAAKKLTFTITQAVNEWSDPPELTPLTWTAGDKSAALDVGEASFGEVKSNYTQDQLWALPAGSYTLKLTVAETANWTALEATFAFTVVAGEDPEPTEKGGVYFWNVTSGNWGAAASWTGVTGGTYPHLASDGAIIPASLASAPTVDLGGGNFTVSQFTNNYAGATVKNGTITFATRFTANAACTLEDVTLVGTGSNPRIYPVYSTAPFTFVGDCRATNATIRVAASGMPLTVRDGTFKMEGLGITFNGAMAGFTVNVENGFFVTPTLANTATTFVNLTLGEDNTSSSEAMIRATTASFASGSTLAVNASGKKAGVYKLISATTFTDSGTFVSGASVTCDSGLESAVAVSGGVVTLTLTSTVTPTTRTSVTPPALSATTAVYDGADHFESLVAPDGCEITYSSKSWTDVGTYTVTLALSDTSKYVWSDSTDTAKTLTFTVTKATNAWTTEPALSATTLEEGDAITVTAGASKFGSVSVNYTAAQIAALSAGSYTFTATVAGTANYTALTKTIAFTVTSKGGTSTVTGGYTLAGSGSWNANATWKGVTSGTYPHLATDYANVPSSLVGAVVDLGGGDYSLNILTNNSKNVTFENGTLRLYQIRTTLKTGVIALRDVTVIGKGTSDSYLWNAADANNFTTNAFYGTCRLEDFCYRPGRSGLTMLVKDGALTLTEQLFIYDRYATTCFDVVVDNATITGTSVGQYVATQVDSVDFKLTLGENNTTASEGMIVFSGACKICSGSTLTVDATAKGAGTYTLIKAGTLTDNASLATKATVKVADGFKATVSAASNAITLTIETTGSAYTPVAIPTLPTTTAVYDGVDKRPAISCPTGCKLTYSATTWLNAGTYTVTCSLTDTSTYRWSDGTASDKTLTFTVTKAENSWTVEPALSSTSFEAGTAVTVTTGAAAFGTVSANLDAATIAALAAGSYTFTATVEGTDNYSGLTVNIPFTVTAKVVPTEKAGCYVVAGSGAWTGAASWVAFTGSSYPHLAADGVSALSTLAADATIDLAGGSYAIFGVTNLSAKTLALKNGTLKTTGLVETRSGNLSFENMTLQGDGTSATYLRAYVDGATIAFVGDNALQSRMLRITKNNTTVSFKDGTTTSDSRWNFAVAYANYAVNVRLDNARITTTEIEPTSSGGSATPIKLLISVNLGANNVAGGDAAIAVSGAFLAPSGSTLAIDATGKAAGTYKIIEAGTLTDTANLAGSATVTVDEGVTATVAKSGNAIVLTLEAPQAERTKITVPTLAASSAAYDGADHKPSIAATDAYAVSYSAAQWIDAGSYSVVCTLNDTENYEWADGTTAAKTLAFTVTKATNAWTSEPSLASTSFEVGSIIAVSAGSAKFGTATANYNAVTLAALAAGSYTFTATVEGTANYAGLTKSIAFTVSAAGGGDTPGTVSGAYTWKNASGTWNLAANWTSFSGGVYPALAADTVSFPAASGSGTRCDLAGGEYTVATVVNAASGDITLANGKLTTSGSIANNGKMTLENVTLVGTGSTTSTKYLVNNGAASASSMTFVGDNDISGRVLRFRYRSTYTFRDGVTECGTANAWNTATDYGQTWDLVFENARVNAKFAGLETGTWNISVKLGDNNVAGGSAVMAFANKMTVGSGSKLTIDATGKAAGTYAIISDAAGDYAGFAGTVTATVDSGKTYSVDTTKSGLSLVIEGGEVVNVVVPALSAIGCAYDGADHAEKVAATEFYTVAYSADKWVDVGVYTVTCTLVDTTLLQWADGTTAPKVLSFAIAKAVNEWTAEPSLAVTAIERGSTVEISLGTPKFGTVTANYDAAAIAALAEGSYTFTATVAETENWGALKKDIAFTVVGRQISDVETTRPEFAVATAVYDGVDHRQTLAADNYDVVYSATTWIDAGTYTAVCTPKSGYCWTGGTYEAITLTFTVTKAANSWTSEPTMTPKTVVVGEEPTITLGAAAIGTPTANFTAADVAALAVGSYDLIVTVPESANYQALTAEIAFTVVDEKPTEEATGHYTWRGTDSAWASAANWLGVENGTWPHTDKDIAYFGGQGVTTIDLGDATYAISGFTNKATGLTFANGAISVFNRLTLGSSTTFRNMTLNGRAAGARLYPMVNGTAITFDGDNSVGDNLTYRMAYPSEVLNFTGGATSFETDFTYSTYTAQYTLSINLDDACVTGKTLVPDSNQSVQLAIAIKLGSRNVAGGDAALAFSGSVKINTGSSLTIDATDATVGTYKIIEAGTLTDVAGIATGATVTYGADMDGTLAVSGNALTLTITSTLPPAEDKPVVNGKEVEPTEVFNYATRSKNIWYSEAPGIAGEVGSQQITSGDSVVAVPAYYTAIPDGNYVKLEFNENVVPEIADGHSSGAITLKDGKIVLHAEGTYSALYYALSSSEKPDGTFEIVVPYQKYVQDSVNIEDSVEDDSRFYQILVTDDPTAE